MVRLLPGAYSTHHQQDSSQQKEPIVTPYEEELLSTEISTMGLHISVFAMLLMLIMMGLAAI